MRGWLWILVVVAALGAATAPRAAADDIRLHVITNDFVLPSKLDRLAEFGAPEGVAVGKTYVEGLSGDDKTWLDADLIILDTPRGNDRAQVMAAVGDALEGTQVPWLAIGGGRPLSGNIPRDIQGQLYAYYQAGGAENFRNLMRFISAWKRGGDMAGIPAAGEMPPAGFYHPDAPRLFASLEDYLAWGQDRWKANAPRLAVAISDGYVSNMQTAVIDALVSRLEAAGGVPLIFWFDGKAEDGLQRMIARAGASTLVNMTHMTSGDARKAEFEALDMPVVMAFIGREGTADEWRAAAQGIPARTASALMAAPESWGMSDPVVLGAVESGEPVPIPEQVDLLVGRFLKMARLQKTAQAERKVALLFWNSPGGERNISASNLNVPKSIETIMQSLSEAGYTLTPQAEQEVITGAQALLAGYYHPETLEDLYANGKAVAFPVADYQAWFAALPAAIRDEVTNAWGAPEQHWSVRDVDGKPAFIIPLIQTGNFMFLPQPPRADKVGESYHDLKQPPGHLYLATYLYLRESFEADAFIHLGTHGTQEWTPGKDRGLWAYDYPFLLVGNVPVFYPYIQDNIGEAMQAKRRGRATVISHQTPAFAPSGLYDELRDIHDLIHEFQQLDAGAVRDGTIQKIIEAVVAADMHKDMGWTEEAVRSDFLTFAPVLHDHMHALAQTVTPLGLHTFGTPAAEEHRISTIMQQLGSDYYAALGIDAKEVFANDFSELKAQEPYAFLARFISGGENPDDIEEPVLREMIRQAVANEKRLAETGEIEALIKGLDGGFVLPGMGGDPVRNPETTSGTNMYAFEPDKIPTRAAYEAGAKAFESLVEAYARDHDGAYPDKLAFSLWSSDAIRTLGIAEAQVMHALGVRPVWDRGGRVTALEMIPQSELGRPRVDVVIQVTSVYRDQFDAIMRNYAAAIEALAALPESESPVAVNVAKVRASLMAKGVDAAVAKRLAAIRIFSNPPGDYGSGVTQAAMDSTSWDDDSYLAETYFNSQSFAYGSEDWGTPVREMALFEAQLEGVQAAIFSRSTNLHGLVSTDHPFEYLGGLSAAVRAVNGESPSLYVTDLRNKEPKMAKASEFLSTELRARYQNPQWIGAMKAEGYAGTVNMLKVVNNLFGWQVMDRSMVREDQWQAMHETYVMDARNMDLNAWFEANNPTAQAQIIERMTEAIRKGYWDASEQTRRELVERWQDLTNELGADKGAEKTVAFLEDMAAGFGMSSGAAPVDAAAEATTEPEASPANEQATPVRGQVMQQVPDESAEPQPTPLLSWIMWLLLFISFIGGIARSFTDYNKALRPTRMEQYP